MILIKRWFNISDKIRFLLVGGFNAGVSYLMYSAFCIILGETSYQTALAIAWIISSVVSFTTQNFLYSEVAAAGCVSILNVVLRGFSAI